MPDTLTAYDGTQVDVEHVKTLATGGARFELETDDGRRWRIDVTKHGNAEVVTSWEDGTLADLEMPEWTDDVLRQFQMVA